MSTSLSDRRPGRTPARRCVLGLLACAAGMLATPLLQAQATHAGNDVLSLYGLALKDTSVEAFVAAARAAGGVPLPTPPGAPPVLDARGSGVPALERLTVIGHEGRLVTARFAVKDYGQDNQTLRQMLLAKYGVPMAMSARPLPAVGFDGRASPRGTYAWAFADGMKLVYEHQRIGEVTLSYTDEAKARALAAGTPLPGAAPSTAPLAPPSADPLRDRL